jgi:hypothetical protein
LEGWVEGDGKIKSTTLGFQSIIRTTPPPPCVSLALPVLRLLAEAGNGYGKAKIALVFSIRLSVHARKYIIDSL